MLAYALKTLGIIWFLVTLVLVVICVTTTSINVLANNLVGTLFCFTFLMANLYTAVKLGKFILR